MPARSLCQKSFKNILEPLHLYRRQSLIEATSVVINVHLLHLFSIGRDLSGVASVRHKIKRIDRLRGKSHLQNEVSDTFSACY